MCKTIYRNSFSLYRYNESKLIFENDGSIILLIIVSLLKKMKKKLLFLSPLINEIITYFEGDTLMKKIIYFQR